jgi:hypothetical protein
MFMEEAMNLSWQRFDRIVPFIITNVKTAKLLPLYSTQFGKDESKGDCSHHPCKACWEAQLKQSHYRSGQAP